MKIDIKIRMTDRFREYGEGELKKIIMLVLCLVWIAGPNLTVLGRSESPWVSLCELITNPESYNGCTVKVTGILVVGQENTALYDPECKKQRADIYVSLGKNVPGPMKKCIRLIKQERRALVVFEGIFHGPEPVAIDPKLPDVWKERMKSWKKRYGHLGAYDTMIEVTRLLSVEPVETDTLW